MFHKRLQNTILTKYNNVIANLNDRIGCLAIFVAHIIVCWYSSPIYKRDSRSLAQSQVTLTPRSSTNFITI